MYFFKISEVVLNIKVVVHLEYVYNFFMSHVRMSENKYVISTYEHPLARDHSVNVITGVFFNTYAIGNFADCDLIMWCILNLLLITTIIFHGCHVLEYDEIADKTFMKYDIFLVVLFVLRSVVLTLYCWFIINLSIFSLLIWCLSFFRCYRRLPYNPVASFIHICGVVGTNYAANHYC
jgi:hypothetical protein